VTHLDDDRLTAALAADLDAGFEALVRAYQDRLYAFGLRLTTSPRDAEEIAQDAFVRAYRALVTYPEERILALRPRAWLFQIAINVTRNRARVRRVSEVPLGLPSDGEDRSASAAASVPADDAHRPDVVAERRDEDRQLAALVGSLPERYRAAVVLRHVQGLSYQEVAEILGQPAGTVKSNVHRGVALLRAALGDAREGPSPPAPLCLPWGPSLRASPRSRTRERGSRGDTLSSTNVPQQPMAGLCWS
jgi:RNA polymerase sigma-70 factor (ECF subfamily)